MTDTFTLKIEKLIYGGCGMGKLDGKAIFVPYVVPGDLVEVEIIDHHKTYAYARVKKIVENSEHRVEPACKYYGVCGGCHLQHIDYATQLLWKQIILEEQFLRIGGGLEGLVSPTIPSPFVWGYRNRIQLHKKGKKIGYFKINSHELVEIDSCPIADEAVNKSIVDFQKTASDINDERIEISDISYFSQVNSYVNVKLKKIVVEQIEEIKPQSVLELYAGSGNLTFDVAKIVKKVVAVESDKLAVKEGEKILAEQEIKNVEFIMSTVEKFFEMQPRLNSENLCILADPPREGLGKGVVETLVGLRPRLVVYVSCNPSTLARDAKMLSQHGYSIQKCQPLDMFPQTYHIESVTSFLRGCNP